MKLLKTLLLIIATHLASAQVNCETTPDQLGPYFY